MAEENFDYEWEAQQNVWWRKIGRIFSFIGGLLALLCVWILERIFGED